MQLDAAQVTTEEVKAWEGVHLLHFQASSCSQKVRILLPRPAFAKEIKPRGIGSVAFPLSALYRRVSRTGLRHVMN